MKKTEIHTLIVWSAATDLVPEVVSCVQSKLSVLDKIEIKWQPDTFLNNLKIFYAHSQREKQEDAYNGILERKISQIGMGTFCLLVLKDENPQYDYRLTTSGNRYVNTNIFDLKKSVRQLVGGGNRIHASDNEFESNKDLTLLLHKNTEDYLKASKQNTYHQNVLGYDGYADIKELFYVLNNSIDYCVLRNYECLPDEYTLKGHGDIDLLVENHNYAKYLTLAKPVFPDLHYRVHYTIKIKGEEIPFDFRFLGDDYYDIKWQKKILESRKLYNDLVYVPDAENYFYSLLYHAYVQKKVIKEDYYPKIEELAQANRVDYHRKMSHIEVKKILDKFLEDNFYRYIPANDPTVIYNVKFLNVLETKSKYGKKLSSTLARTEGEVYFSEVYQNDNSIVKICSDVIAFNEKTGLTLLENFGFTPKLLGTEKINDSFSKVEIQFLEGQSFKEVIDRSLYFSREQTRQILLQFVESLIVLNDKGLSHRDIRPDNIILNLESNKIFIIDFGWCVSLSEKQPLTPIRLGSRYKFKEGMFSDAYSFGKLLQEYFREHSGKLKLLVKKFLDIRPEDYQNGLAGKKLQKIKQEIECDFESYFTKKDTAINLLYKTGIFSIKAGMKKRVKKIMNIRF